MSNDTEIRPALTAEEWAEGDINRPNLWAQAMPDLLVCRTPGDRSTLADGEDRHALAALALYKQPYGFTREDVTAIEAARDFCRARHMRGHVALETLATRIAALLPPSPEI